MTDYQFSGKIDFIQPYNGQTILIIKGDDGNSYAAKKEDVPKSKRSSVYKGKAIHFNCEAGKKIAWEVRV